MSYIPTQRTRTFPRQGGGATYPMARTRQFSRTALSGVGAGRSLRYYNRRAMGDDTITTTDQYGNIITGTSQAQVDCESQASCAYDTSTSTCNCTAPSSSSTSTTGTKAATTSSPSLASQIIGGIFGTTPSSTTLPPGYVPPTSIMSSPMFLPLLIGGGIIVYMIAKK